MEEKLLEQPNLETSNQNKTNDEIENQDGSMLGKFKDAKSLLDAYNNLQSEFTRKSQKLAEFEKNKEENAVFEKFNNIDDFINSTTDSGKYKKEITEIIDNNDDINNLPNKYQIAYKIAKLADCKSAETLNNQEFLDNYITNNENIKEKIISEYLSKLNNISTTPKTIQGNASSVYFSPNTAKPRTLKEAGEIFKKMLK